MHKLFTTTLTFLVCVSLAFASLASTKVGVVGASNPDVKATRVNGEVRTLKAGDDIFLNDTIETNTNGSAQLMFLDKSALTVSPDSNVTIDTFVYDPATQNGSMTLNSAKGALRLVGGALTKRKPVKIKTPVSTIGVRGGIVDAHINKGGQTDAVFLFGKEMTMTNQNGNTVSTSQFGTGLGIANGSAMPKSLPPGAIRGHIKNSPVQTSASRATNIGNGGAIENKLELNSGNADRINHGSGDKNSNENNGTRGKKGGQSKDNHGGGTPDQQANHDGGDSASSPDNNDTPSPSDMAEGTDMGDPTPAGDDGIGDIPQNTPDSAGPVNLKPGESKDLAGFQDPTGNAGYPEGNDAGEGSALAFSPPPVQTSETGQEEIRDNVEEFVKNDGDANGDGVLDFNVADSGLKESFDDPKAPPPADDDTDKEGDDTPPPPAGDDTDKEGDDTPPPPAGDDTDKEGDDTPPPPADDNTTPPPTGGGGGGSNISGPGSTSVDDTFANGMQNTSIQNALTDYVYIPSDDFAPQPGAEERHGFTAGFIDVDDSSAGIFKEKYWNDDVHELQFSKNSNGDFSVRFIVKDPGNATDRLGFEFGHNVDQRNFIDTVGNKFGADLGTVDYLGDNAGNTMVGSKTEGLVYANGSGTYCSTCEFAGWGYWQVDTTKVDSAGNTYQDVSNLIPFVTGELTNVPSSGDIGPGGDQVYTGDIIMNHVYSSTGEINIETGQFQVGIDLGFRKFEYFIGQAGGKQFGFNALSVSAVGTGSLSSIIVPGNTLGPNAPASTANVGYEIPAGVGGWHGVEIVNIDSSAPTSDITGTLNGSLFGNDDPATASIDETAAEIGGNFQFDHVDGSSAAGIYIGKR